jgi:hypothetical protein
MPPINHSDPKDWGFVEKAVKELDTRLQKIEEVPADKQTAKTLADLEARVKKLESAPKADPPKADAKT